MKEMTLNEAKEIIEKLTIQRNDMRKYIIDTDKYGIDQETLSDRAERYKDEINKESQEEKTN